MLDLVCSLSFLTKLEGKPFSQVMSHSMHHSQAIKMELQDIYFVFLSFEHCFISCIICLMDKMFSMNHSHAPYTFYSIRENICSILKMDTVERWKYRYVYIFYCEATNLVSYIGSRYLTTKFSAWRKDDMISHEFRSYGICNTVLCSFIDFMTSQPSTDCAEL